MKKADPKNRPQWLRELIQELGEPDVFSDIPTLMPGRGGLKRRFWVWFVEDRKRNHNIGIDQKGEMFAVDVNGYGTGKLTCHSEPGDEAMRHLLRWTNFAGEGWEDDRYQLVEINLREKPRAAKGA